MQCSSDLKPTADQRFNNQLRRQCVICSNQSERKSIVRRIFSASNQHVFETIGIIIIIINETIEVNSNLTDEQRNQLINLLVKYKDVISLHDYDLGRCTTIKHHIDTGDHPPIKCAPYRVSPAKRDEIDKQVDGLLGAGCAKESESAWAFPVVLIKKKDGTWRMCIDIRLNRITKTDAYPLRRVDDAIDAIGNAQFLSTLDLVKAYNQLALDEESQEKCAFVTHSGLYQCTTVPFGIKNGPGSFQRLIDQVLKGLNWKQCIAYLDDILIFSNTFGEHLVRLENVFKRLQEHNLKIKLNYKLSYICYF